MTTPRIEGSSPVVSSPEVESHQTEPHPAPAKPVRSREANQVDAWSSPAADEAAQEIASSYGYGIFPDMETISKDFGKLDGFALLKTLNKLEANGKLEDVLNRMPVDDRQKLVNQAVKGNLVERDAADRLKPKFELPAAFQKMTDELNLLQSKQSRGADLTYNWSSYQEDAHDVVKRKFVNQISSLQPGESISMDAKLEVSGKVATVNGEAGVGVERNEDGSYTISSELSAAAGAYLKFGPELEGTFGTGARVEYRFANAKEAKAAADLFATNPAEAVEKYGQPSAIEGKTKLSAELSASIGVSPVKLGKLKSTGELEASLRIELGGKKPMVELKLEAKTDSKIAHKIGLGPASAEVRGIDAHATGKMTIEVRTELADPNAFLHDPAGWLRANAGKAEAKLSFSADTSALHHATSRKVEISTTTEELTRALMRTSTSTEPSEILRGLGSAAQVKIVEKKSLVQHYGADFKLELPVGHVNGGAGYERKTPESEKILFKGSATKLYDAATS